MNTNENMELNLENDQLSMDELDDIAGGCRRPLPPPPPFPHRPFPPRPFPPRPIPPRPRKPW